MLSEFFTFSDRETYMLLTALMTVSFMASVIGFLMYQEKKLADLEKKAKK